jgi:hypothetical protein
MTSNAVAELQSFVVEEPNDDLWSDGPNISVSSLPADEQQAVQECITEWKSAGRRLMSELFTMTEQLVKMRQILGRKFGPLVRAELNISRRQAYRYMDMNKVLKAHFTVNGELAWGNGIISQAALSLLAPTTDDSVIQEVKLALGNGKAVDGPMVSELLARRESEHAAALAAAHAEARLAEQKLQRQLQTAEANLGRIQRDTNAQAELLRRNTEARAVLEEENARLRREANVVRFEEKLVEVVPPGFASTEDAIAAKAKELGDLEAQRSALESTITSLTNDRERLRNEVSRISTSTAEFREMKSAIDQIVDRFPLVALSEMAAGDKTLKAAFLALGETMMLYGQRLSQAGQ